MGSPASSVDSLYAGDSLKAASLSAVAMEEQITYSSSELRSPQTSVEPTSKALLEENEEASDYLNEELLSPLCGLCNDLALALVLREGLPECTAALLHKLLPGVVFCAVGLVVEDGHQLLNRVLIQPDSAGLPALALAAESTGSAAWTALKSQAPLVWCRSHEGETRFPEWEKLAVTFGLESVVAVPLQIPGCVPIGCATFAIADCNDPPTAVDPVLEHFCAYLCKAICHNNKNVWEVSLGYLMQVMPPTILQHMLTAAMTSPLGRVGGPPDALPAMLPPVPTPSSMSLNPAPLSTKSGSDEDDVPMRLHAAATATASATAHATAHAGVKVAVPAPLPPALAPLRTALETAVGSPVELAPARGVPCLVASQSHISLEFGAPATEHAFKMWFDASQAVVDHYLARAYALLLTSCMLVAVCCAGEIRAIALLIAMQTGLGKLILVWGTTCCSHEWYATHRTALVVANRVVGTSALVAHWVMHPAFYSGGIVKGAVGRGVARLVLSMTHAKLRFAMHTVAIFLELYVCALANAFAFRGSGVAPDGGWGLRTTAVAQLLAAACSTAINYVLERRTRAIFISSRQH